MRALLPIGKVAHRFGVHPITVARWDVSGKLRGYRDVYGRRWYDPQDVARLERKRAAPYLLAEETDHLRAARLKSK